MMTYPVVGLRLARFSGSRSCWRSWLMLRMVLCISVSGDILWLLLRTAGVVPGVRGDDVDSTGISITVCESSLSKHHCNTAVFKRRFSMVHNHMVSCFYLPDSIWNHEKFGAGVCGKGRGLAYKQNLLSENPCHLKEKGNCGFCLDVLVWCGLMCASC